ncbi:RNA polymerase sigma factor [Thalassotalea ponticola]|uniref:RNA polymerase sigma factor n=1 Tax=Thalassotalea ponticola TaxID=1523392 RepID=UPI0025B4FA57|nr:RNA polymerase sigma factor [Thalassotalea ponticola]MDN3652520.1 RNA polymerase sigma factor [Thalassotalea ponticola]
MGQDYYTQHILPYGALIAKVVRAYSYTEQDFEDRYQEVCLQIWRSRHSFKQQSAMSTWIYRIAVNVCLTFAKKERKDVQLVEIDNITVSAEHQSRCDIKQLYAAIRQLSELDRAIIVLYLDDYQYKQIAEIIGIKANNIGVRINRIKQQLYKLINQDEPEPTNKPAQQQILQGESQ